MISQSRILGTLLLAAVIASALVIPSEATAQQIIIGNQQRYDKVRVSGFWWRSKPQGILNLEDLADVPGLADGIDITDTLGFEDGKNGIILEGNFAAAPRHRFIFNFSSLNAGAERTVSIPGIIDFSSETQIDFREFHAYYNFNIVATPQVEFGVLGGVGWFDIDAVILTNVGGEAGQLDQAFPTFGTNVLMNPKGPFRGYFEITGFPRVNVDDLSGWQLDFIARIEMFFTDSFGVLAGYRYYRVNVDNEVENIGVDVNWQGFMFGAQVRY